MRFRTRIVLMYTALALAAAMILGIGYNRYNIREYRNNAYKNAQFLCTEISERLDNQFNNMKAVSDYILSVPELLYDITRLSSPNFAQTSSEDEQDKLVKELQAGINIDFINRRFYRAVYFNGNGLAVGSTNGAEKSLKTHVNKEELSWISQAEETGGRLVLIGPHKDEWGARVNPLVFSMVKEVQVPGEAYIEVQMQVSELIKLLGFNDDSYQCTVLLEDGTVLCSTASQNALPSYRKLAQQGDEKGSIREYEDPSRNVTELIAMSSPGEYRTRVLVTRDCAIIDREIPNTLGAAFLVAGVFFVIFMVFISIFSLYLTKPIQELRERMEHTQIDNLDESVWISTDNDEIRALENSYQKLLNRLSESMIREKKLSTLQLQAQFDTLQAQVNPHFIYNVLNVMSSRGMNTGDEVLCEMCGSLASMLRYSTSTVEKTARIQEELKYLEQYFFLLKTRYDYRLQYEMEVDSTIYPIKIPKLVIQQLVENCIMHAFNRSLDTMQIFVRGIRKEDSWRVMVEDNGQGISSEALEKLRQKMKALNQRLELKEENVEMEIGGMGLPNIYARMRLLYGNDSIFEIENREEGGARVTIGALIR